MSYNRNGCENLFAIILILILCSGFVGFLSLASNRMYANYKGRLIGVCVPVKVEYIAKPETFGGDLEYTIIYCADGSVKTFTGIFSVTLNKVNKIYTTNGLNRKVIVEN